MSRQASLNLEHKHSQDKINGAEENNEKLEIYSPRGGHDLISNDEEKQKHISSKFGMDAIELENLMGYYKERGADFRDLKYFREKKSVAQLIL